MMTLTATTCARHDTIGGACSQESNTLRYGFHTKHQHACVENFLLAHSWRGMGKRDMTSNINWFMNVPVERRRHARHRRRDLRTRALARPPGRDGRARRHLELPADQQPVQRLRPHTDPPRGHPLTPSWTEAKRVNKVLVANRGEIACRIMRTLDRLGIASVAVFSDADRAAPHVGMAGQAIRIGARSRRRQLPRPGPPPRRRAQHGRRRGAPRLRVPLRACGVRRRGRGRRPRVRRPDARADPQLRRQGLGPRRSPPPPACRCCPDPRPSSTPPTRSQRAERGGLPAAGEERRRRRRDRHARVPRRGRAAGGRRAGHAPERAGLRVGRGVPRAPGAPGASRRGAGVRRRRGRPRRARRPRLLHAAAPPEGGGGDAGAEPRRRVARRAVRRDRAACSSRSATARRARSSSWSTPTRASSRSSR